MQIKIETKNISLNIEAENGFDAIKKFFGLILENKISLDKLGLIGIWYRIDGEKIAFRIPPALYSAKLISLDCYKKSMKQAGLWTGKEDAENMASKDKWMVE